MRARYIAWAMSLVTGEPARSFTDIEARQNGDYHVISAKDMKEKNAKEATDASKAGSGGDEYLGQECEPLLAKEESVSVGYGLRKSSAGKSDPVSEETGYDGISGNAVLKSLYYVVQGLLAGFSFVSLYGREAATNDQTYLMGYQAISADHRRFFYILTTAALVGSLDTAMGVVSQISPHKDRAAAGRRLALTMIPVVAVTVLMHMLCFLVNLSMASFDTLVAHKV
jgi:hypothetical protein